MLIIVFDAMIKNEARAQAPSFKKFVLDSATSRTNARSVAVDGGFLIPTIQTVTDFSGSQRFIAIQKISSSLTKVWDSTYMGLGMVYTNELHACSIDGEAVIAFAKDDGNFGADIEVAKISSNGEVVSQHVFSSNGYDTPTGIVSSQSGIFLTGTLDGNGFVAKMDYSLNTIWMNNYGGFTTSCPSIVGENLFFLERAWDQNFAVIQTAMFLDPTGFVLWNNLVPYNANLSASVWDFKEQKIVLALRNQNDKLCLASIDVGGNFSPLTTTMQKADVYKIVDTEAGVIVCGVNLGSSGGAYGAEFSTSNFSLLWERKESGSGNYRYFSDIAGKTCGQIFVGAQARQLAWPQGAVTYDLILTRANYVAPVVSVTPSGPITICKPDSVLLTVLYDLNSTYQWKRYANNVANSSELYVSKSGNYKVVVTNRFGCSKTSPVVFVTSVDCNREYLSDNNEEKLSVFPNPAENEINVIGMRNFSIFDMAGQKVFESFGSEKETIVDISKILPGMYIIRDDKGKTLKFSKR